MRLRKTLRLQNTLSLSIKRSGTKMRHELEHQVPTFYNGSVKKHFPQYLKYAEVHNEG